ncbi:MAG: MarR family transcriptional regulator [Ilumatobacteraceae bacterium]|nr:MarR family transcriptional regulator [Ilumatobacteraceae bacterium]
MSTERRLVLTAGTVELRRRLDPSAWVVFEQLLLESTDCGDGCRASVSVRSLAAQLGLAKDTVARALNRLRRAGLVEGSQSRTATGVYAIGTYTLSVPTSVTVDDLSQTPPLTSSALPPSRSTATTAQLALPLTP